jgi:hypothetical protein
MHVGVHHRLVEENLFSRRRSSLQPVVSLAPPAMFSVPNLITSQGPSFAEADRLLKELADIPFSAEEHADKIKTTLSAMADWRPETQDGGDILAKLWIERIYKVCVGCSSGGMRTYRVHRRSSECCPLRNVISISIAKAFAAFTPCVGVRSAFQPTSKWSASPRQIQRVLHTPRRSQTFTRSRTAL